MFFAYVKIRLSGKEMYNLQESGLQCKSNITVLIKNDYILTKKKYFGNSNIFV